MGEITPPPASRPPAGVQASQLTGPTMFSGIKVFVTDGNQRKALAATRSLGRKGVRVVVGEETRAPVAAFSRYCSESVAYPSAAGRPAGFEEFLRLFLRTRLLDAFFPMDDAVCDVVTSALASGWNPGVPVALAPPSAYMAARDKFQTYEIAAKRGLRHPATELPDSSSSALRAARRLGFPCVLRPRKTSGGRGLRYIRTERDFVAAYESVQREHGPPLVQEFIPPGDRFDVCMLFDRDEDLRASFVQRELRNYPLDRGPSTVQESTVRPELVESATRLLEKTGWRSVAEVEYMVDRRDSRPVLMEVNPRFWASLACAVAAGVDFPALALLEALGEAVPATHAYVPGVRVKWLLPGGILHAAACLCAGRLPRPLPPAPGGERKDIFEPDDPWPVAGVLSAIASHCTDREMWRRVVRR
ncbi:MAG: ATP-grasp domain-containing protein [Bacillota bacterium]|nr:ATP-grasp domain-containing protein [Bacillota bacterium]